MRRSADIAVRHPFRTSYQRTRPVADGRCLTKLTFGREFKRGELLLPRRRGQLAKQAGAGTTAAVDDSASEERVVKGQPRAVAP